MSINDIDKNNNINNNNKMEQINTNNNVNNIKYNESDKILSSKLYVIIIFFVSFDLFFCFF